jgi:predicted RND superfamily exporter protein
VPVAALWLGSQVVPFTSDMVGIVVAGVVIMAMLVLVLVLLKRLDHVWKLARRAAGHDQKRGMLERIFVGTLIVAASAFLIWFLILTGPGSMLVPERPA